MLMAFLAEFCLLEQILPDGSGHPFAETMLNHFEKLKTPLKSVFEYPSLEAQNRRFSRLGWPHVETVNLWQAWNDDKWMSASKRRELDIVEPFDEWEEFALFASHYCLVIANNPGSDAVSSVKDGAIVAKCLPPQRYPRLLFHAYSGTRGRRRFGAAMQTRDELGEQVFANTFGLGTNDRLRSCDLYAFGSLAAGMRPHIVGPSRRVCHAIADLGQFGRLLIGGRTSPTSALRDCWHYSTEQNTWSPSDDLPLPLYRHGVAQLGRSNMTILIGGKSDSSTIFTGCLMHRPGSGWIGCSISGSAYQPVFGASLICFKTHHLINNDSEFPTLQFEGILAGGLKEDGTLGAQILRWTLKVPADGTPTISFEPIISSTNIESLVCRFGASALLLDGEHVAIVGGFQHDGVVPRLHEILVVNNLKRRPEVVSCCSLTTSDEPSATTPRPLLIGTAVSLAEDGRLLVMGGGATVSALNHRLFFGFIYRRLKSPFYRPQTRFSEALRMSEPLSYVAQRRAY